MELTSLSLVRVRQIRRLRLFGDDRTIGHGDDSILCCFDPDEPIGEPASGIDSTSQSLHAIGWEATNRDFFLHNYRTPS
jgi:hypothetical protein